MRPSNFESGFLGNPGEQCELLPAPTIMLEFEKAEGSGCRWSQWPWDIITCLMEAGSMLRDRVSCSMLVCEGMGLKCLCRPWIKGG